MGLERYFDNDSQDYIEFPWEGGTPPTDDDVEKIKKLRAVKPSIPSAVPPTSTLSEPSWWDKIYSAGDNLVHGDLDNAGRAFKDAVIDPVKENVIDPVLGPIQPLQWLGEQSADIIQQNDDPYENLFSDAIKGATSIPSWLDLATLGTGSVASTAAKTLPRTGEALYEASRALDVASNASALGFGADEVGEGIQNDDYEKILTGMLPIGLGAHGLSGYGHGGSKIPEPYAKRVPGEAIGPNVDLTDLAISNHAENFSGVTPQGPPKFKLDEEIPTLPGIENVQAPESNMYKVDSPEYRDITAPKATVKDAFGREFNDSGKMDVELPEDISLFEGIKRATGQDLPSSQTGAIGEGVGPLNKFRDSQFKKYGKDWGTLQTPEEAAFHEKLVKGDDSVSFQKDEQKEVRSLVDADGNINQDAVTEMIESATKKTGLKDVRRKGDIDQLFDEIAGKNKGKKVLKDEFVPETKAVKISETPEVLDPSVETINVEDPYTPFSKKEAESFKQQIDLTDQIERAQAVEEKGRVQSAEKQLSGQVKETGKIEAAQFAEREKKIRDDFKELQRRGKEADRINNAQEREKVFLEKKKLGEEYKALQEAKGLSSKIEGAQIKEEATNIKASESEQKTKFREQMTELQRQEREASRINNAQEKERVTVEKKKLRDEYRSLREQQKLTTKIESAQVKEQKAMDKTLSNPNEKTFLDDLTDLPKTLKSSFDLSGGGRQNLFLLNRPEALKGVMRGHKSLVEKYHLDVRKDLASRPYKDLYEKFNLAQVDYEPGASPAKADEFFPSKLADKIPGVKQSERVFIDQGNLARANMFDQYTDTFSKAGKTPETHPELYESMAEYLNTLTGRSTKLDIPFGGSLPLRMGKASKILNKAFWSPRFVASRVQLLNPAFYARLPKELQKEALRDVGGTVAIGAGVLAGTSSLLKSMGYETSFETDPRHTDFGKLRVDKTTYDLSSGLIPLIRTASRLGSGVVKTRNGEYTYPNRNDGSGLKNTPFNRNEVDELLNFSATKASPIVTAPWDYHKGVGFAGEKYGLPELLRDLLEPMSVSEFREALHRYDLGTAASTLPGFFGAGVQVDLPDSEKASYNSSSKKKKSKRNHL